ncbi:SAM-dependent methyltransferase [Dethiosulfatarculus sandiegensis]|uniref:Tetrapyrrole methylase domain-containing protein n=1 Tax=Dethiosulfatarculus sandiegensis TaxID=1429043 RepID=A0A0D2GGL8_9BACT|nr:SAM-dependent methyltransferase [Dethiosulfatarculus sandiegensis]KIX14027.1 hypothetical protein X474_10845 [Dethiosulfatarculus sandiegensis]
MRTKTINSLLFPIIFALLLIASLANAGTSGQHSKKDKACQADIYLIGVGPGDVDLITISAQKTVHKADVIVCNPQLAKQFGRLLDGKELLLTGLNSYRPRKGLAGGKSSEADRQPGEIKKDQNRIIKTVRTAVKGGKVVAFLDYGDPMVYGNWLWCLDVFKDLNLKVEPGVCLFHAANAVLGEDISFSDISKSIILTTNDACGERDTIDKLASNSAAMVIYCSPNNFDVVLRKLSGKYKPETKIALVPNSTCVGKQAVISGTIANIEEVVATQKLAKEFLVFIGANLDLPKSNIATKPAKKKGKLYLVGLFPGNPDLATLRATNVVKGSDLIINQFDFINAAYKHILEGKEVWAPSNKKAWTWHGYGKSADDFSGKNLERFLASEKARQETVSKVRQAIEKGQQVCVLDFGDPLTYAPWCWVLQEFADLAPIVIPGISSFDAANAALKKSVTQGAKTKSAILTVPDVDDWLNKKAFDFDEMLERQTSLVIFMPDYMITLPDMVKKLSAYYDRKTPIALVVCAGFKKGEKVIKGRLDNIVDLVGRKKLPFLHLMYVGSFLE